MMYEASKSTPSFCLQQHATQACKNVGPRPTVTRIEQVANTTSNVAVFHHTLDPPIKHYANITCNVAAFHHTLDPPIKNYIILRWYPLLRDLCNFYALFVREDDASCNKSNKRIQLKTTSDVFNGGVVCLKTLLPSQGTRSLRLLYVEEEERVQSDTFDVVHSCVSVRTVSGRANGS